VEEMIVAEAVSGTTLEGHMFEMIVATAVVRTAEALIAVVAAVEAGLDVMAAAAGVETTADPRQQTTAGRNRPGTTTAEDTPVVEEEEGEDRAGTPGVQQHKHRTTGQNPPRGMSAWSWNSLALATAHLVSTLIDTRTSPWRRRVLTFPPASLSLVK